MLMSIAIGCNAAGSVRGAYPADFCDQNVYMKSVGIFIAVPRNFVENVVDQLYDQL